jgi:hypothetical protein
MLGNILELNVERCRGKDNPQRPIWKVIHALLIWRERIRCLFEDCESNVVQLKASFLSSLLEWAATFLNFFFDN